jgi:hypothetical protein
MGEAEKEQNEGSETIGKDQFSIDPAGTPLPDSEDDIDFTKDPKVDARLTKLVKAFNESTLELPKDYSHPLPYKKLIEAISPHVRHIDMGDTAHNNIEIKKLFLSEENLELYRDNGLHTVFLESPKSYQDVFNRAMDGSIGIEAFKGLVDGSSWLDEKGKLEHVTSLFNSLSFASKNDMEVKAADLGNGIPETETIKQQLDWMMTLEYPNLLESLVGLGTDYTVMGLPIAGPSAQKGPKGLEGLTDDEKQAFSRTYMDHLLANPDMVKKLFPNLPPIHEAADKFNTLLTSRTSDKKLAEYIKTQLGKEGKGITLYGAGHGAKHGDFEEHFGKDLESIQIDIYPNYDAFLRSLKTAQAETLDTKLPRHDWECAYIMDQETVIINKNNDSIPAAARQAIEKASKEHVSSASGPTIENTAPVGPAAIPAHK